jgi:peptide/nickel transport system substrate-binding protein
LVIVGAVSLLAMMVFVGCNEGGQGRGDGQRPSQPQGRLVVGTNAMNGDMFSGWTNLTANADAKALMAGYSTIYYTDDDRFLPDPVVVRSFTTTENADGGKTYTFEINRDLVYTDGTSITARDYVFAYLFDYSPFMRDLAAQRWIGGEWYQGFEAYNSGVTDVFTGARLYDEYTFSITIAPYSTSGDASFPFWFEITYASSAPLPMHVLAPGCDVEDTGNGVRITGPWSLSLLQSTVDNGSTGYRYNPTVTSGPYKFVSYDAGATTLTLEVNELWKGSGDQRTLPLIQNLIFFTVGDAVAIDALRTGHVDILIQNAGATLINPGLDLVDRGIANYVSYPRNGYGKITFHADWGPTQFEEVRRAIAWSMDREEFVRQFTGGFGVIVNSRIGLAQWMFRENRAALERDLIVYNLNLARAREELDSGGWTLDAQGNAYTGTGVRHKRMPDGSLMALVLEWFSPNANVVGEMLATFITENARSVGMELRQDFGDMQAFANALYGFGKRYNMINGGTGFATVDSPWYYYQPDETRFGQWNGNFIIDERLDGYTQQMRNTEPGDYESFSRHWMNFVTHFNRTLPDLPLYSDEYHDFFNVKLHGYTRTALYPWYMSMLQAWVDD